LLIEIPEATTVLPQSPWTVPSGYYTRPDGSVVYIEHEHQLRGDAGLNPNVSSSTKCLPGEYNQRSVENGRKSC
jgi:hypothetical protein